MFLSTAIMEAIQADRRREIEAAGRIHRMLFANLEETAPKTLETAARPPAATPRTGRKTRANDSACEPA